MAEQTKLVEKDNSRGHAWLAVAVLLLLGGFAFVAVLQQPYKPQGVMLPTPVQHTALITASDQKENALGSAMPAEIADVVKNASAYDGKLVVVEGLLGHRTRSAYGWNLDFDLFDPQGNWLQLKGVDPKTETSIQYKAIGKITASKVGAEMEVFVIDPIKSYSKTGK